MASSRGTALRTPDCQAALTMPWTVAVGMASRTGAGVMHSERSIGIELAGHTKERALVAVDACAFQRHTFSTWEAVSEPSLSAGGA
jgi:hypothetical protein